MKNIGIVTYYKIYNYGSVLQAYALSNTVKKLGYNPEIIDYLDTNQKCFKKIKYKTYRNRILTSLKNPKLFISTIKTKFVGDKFVANIEEEHKKLFDDFINNNLTLSKVDVLKDDDYYDYYICGSDQVWQISAPGLHELYYLRFTKKEKRIAYAPSFGSLTIPKYNVKRLKKYLNEFSNISVREKSGIDIVYNIINKKVTQVLDPVLLESSMWKDKVKEIEDKRYIVGYFLGDISKYEDEIKQIEDKYKAKVIFVKSGREQSIKREEILLSPEDFISFIANAKYVITDSLHGTEFAMVFHKPFSVLARQYISVPEQKTRIESLLDLFKLKNRFIDKTNNYTIDEINYDEFEKILKTNQEKSIDFLEQALNLK